MPCAALFKVRGVRIDNCLPPAFAKIKGLGVPAALYGYLFSAKIAELPVFPVRLHCCPPLSFYGFIVFWAEVPLCTCGRIIWPVHGTKRGNSSQALFSESGRHFDTTVGRPL